MTAAVDDVAASPRAEDGALAVAVGGVEFGIPVRHVREVLRVPPITRIPFPPPSIRGVTSVRGVVVPVLDLGHRLLATPAQAAGRLVVVTDPTTASPVGLLVDQVYDLVEVTHGGQAPPSEVEASLPAGWIADVLAPSPERLVTLLHLEPILLLDDAAKERE